MKEINTTSDCPECGRTVPATIFEKNGDLWMRKTCPDHGEVEGLFWRNAGLYERIQALDANSCPTFPTLDGMQSIMAVRQRRAPAITP